MNTRPALAVLLRAWRDRLSPAAVGMPPGGGRRAPGLRREELAVLAGLSVDYLIRLEQGRADRPSEQVVGVLARALQLSEAEREQLYLAANLPAPTPAQVPTHIPASVQRLLARLTDVAVAVYTTHWTVLTANPAWTALLGHPEPGRNLVVQEFLGGGLPVVQTEEQNDRYRRAMVSDLRNASIRYPHDPSVGAVVERLRRESPSFVELWDEGTIVEHRSKRKTFIHPAIGEITLDCDVFSAVGTDLRIVTYTADPNSEDASKFDLLRTVGVVGS